MKEEYEKPFFELIEIESEDVICTSADTDVNPDLHHLMSE